MLAYMVQHFFAGLWSMIWHFGVGIALVILLVAAGYFIPVVFTKLKILCYVLAAFIVAVLVGEVVGVQMERSHTAAQTATTNAYVKKTVKGTTTRKARGAKDPWNRRTY